MQIVATEQAVADLAALRAGLPPSDGMAASRLGIQLMAALDRLEFHSQRGRPGPVAGTRELLEVWPYRIVYRTMPDAVQVLRICKG